MRKRSILPILAVLFVFMSIFSVYSIFRGDKAKEKASVIKQASQTSQTSKKEVLQKKTYPNLNKYSNLEIHVSSTRQTMTITSNDKVIFKTIVSTGAKESPTPKGTFVIEPERGDFSITPHQKKEPIIGSPLKNMVFISFIAFRLINKEMRFQKKQSN